MAEPGRYQPRAEHAAPESGKHQVPLGNTFATSHIYVKHYKQQNGWRYAIGTNFKKLQIKLHVLIQLESEAHKLCKTPK